MDLYQIGYSVAIGLGRTDGSTEQATASGVEYLWADTEDEARTLLLTTVVPANGPPVTIVACEKCPAEMLPIFEAVFPRPGAARDDGALFKTLGIDPNIMEDP